MCAHNNTVNCDPTPVALYLSLQYYSICENTIVASCGRLQYSSHRLLLHNSSVICEPRALTSFICYSSAQIYLELLQVNFSLLNINFIYCYSTIIVSPMRPQHITSSVVILHHRSLCSSSYLMTDNQSYSLWLHNSSVNCESRMLTSSIVTPEQ